MEIPAPLLSGSVAYLVLTLTAMASGVALRMTGKLDSENAKIFILLSFIGGVCLWMFWACAWLHQWHILIVPTYNKAE